MQLSKYLKEHNGRFKVFLIHTCYCFLLCSINMTSLDRILTSKLVIEKGTKEANKG